MKRLFAVTLALLLAGSSAILFTSSASAKSKGWTTLLNGNSLDNWDQIGTANRRLAKAAAVADQDNGFLVTRKDYTSYKLRVQAAVAGGRTERYRVRRG